VLLSIVLVGGSPLAVRAQTTKASNAPAATATPNANAANNLAQAPAEGEPEKPSPTVEAFKDERAAPLLDVVKFRQLGRVAPPQIINTVKSMGAGSTTTDRATIERFVQHCIAELTSHTNLRALIDPAANIPAGSRAHFAIQEATDNLIEPILNARAARNTGFLTTYNQVLLQMLPPLLEGHLLTRIEAMIVLAQTGSPDVVDIFVKQLNDRDQTVWVKLWAARGLTNIEQLSNYNLDDPRAIRAGKAVADFLNEEKDIPWPVQYRALEALGSLRWASTPRPANGQPEMAGAAMRFLTDPEARLEVRAEAGWALGMMQVNAGIAKYNFSLIAYAVGEVAASLGERVHNSFPENVTLAAHWSALLMSQIHQVFDGIPNARDSGLLRIPHPNNEGAVRTYVRQVADLTRPGAGPPGAGNDRAGCRRAFGPHARVGPVDPRDPRLPADQRRAGPAARPGPGASPPGRGGGAAAPARRAVGPLVGVG
jgi:hypothetical protein